MRWWASRCGSRAALWCTWWHPSGGGLLLSKWRVRRLCRLHLLQRARRRWSARASTRRRWPAWSSTRRWRPARRRRACRRKPAWAWRRPARRRRTCRCDGGRDRRGELCDRERRPCARRVPRCAASSAATVTSTAGAAGLHLELRAEATRVVRLGRGAGGATRRRQHVLRRRRKRRRRRRSQRGSGGGGATGHLLGASLARCRRRGHVRPIHDVPHELPPRDLPCIVVVEHRKHLVKRGARFVLLVNVRRQVQQRGERRIVAQRHHELPHADCAVAIRVRVLKHLAEVRFVHARERLEPQPRAPSPVARFRGGCTSGRIGWCRERRRARWRCWCSCRHCCRYC